MPRPHVYVTSFTVAAFLISFVPLEAQDSPAAVGESSVKMELGVTGAAFLPPARTYGVGLRLALYNAVDDRFSFEAEVDWMDLGRSWRFPDQVIWLFFWQVRQMLVRPEGPPPRFFVTYGTTGWTERTRRGGRLESLFIPPLFPIIGFGGQHSVAKRAIVRGDAQLIWFMGGTLITPRFSGGVSIPIGAHPR